MATRNLTEVYILMRNNSLQSRHIYSEQNVSDRMSLVPLRQTSAQSNLLEAGQVEEDCSPPTWANYLEDAHWTLEKVRSKIEQLDKLHREHLNRPSLDDSSEEEKRIENATQEIVRILGGCHNLVMRVRAGGEDGSPKEQLLSRNAVSALAGSLQDVTGNFRQKKATYHEKLASREKRARPNFESVSLADEGSLSEANWLSSTRGGGPASVSVYNPYLEDSTEDRNFILSGHHLHSEQAQLYLLEESAREAEERERNVHEIARAVVDLHDVFKDLATMVADQGTVLDRIDYNVEQCQVSVHEGFKQLQSAANYKKRDRKMMCILMLASMTMLLFIILIIVKS